MEQALFIGSSSTSALIVYIHCPHKSQSGGFHGVSFVFVFCLFICLEPIFGDPGGYS